MHILLNAQSTYNDVDGDRDVMKGKYWYWQIYMIYKVLDILVASKRSSFIFDAVMHHSANNTPTLRMIPPCEFVRMQILN